MLFKNGYVKYCVVSALRNNVVYCCALLCKLIDMYELYIVDDNVFCVLCIICSAS